MAFTRYSTVSDLSTKSLPTPTYTHRLYSIKSTKPTSMNIAIEESYFSSCSTSPNSSCASLDMYPTTMRSRGSSQSTAVSATGISSVLSTKRTSHSSFASTRFADDYYPLINSIPSDRSLHSSILSMAQAYNTYIRAINSCYNNAATVERDELSDFLFFNQILFNILSQHLRFDKQHLQSLIRQPIAGCASMNIHEDSTFHVAFNAWAKYIHSPSSQKFYTSDDLQSCIIKFAPILVQHLHDEVFRLSFLVNDNVLIPDHLEKIWSTFEDALSASLDIHTDMALLIGCHDKAFTINGCRSEQKFPKLSRPTTTLVKRWHSRKHNGAWQFCSSDFNGKRRMLSI